MSERPNNSVVDRREVFAWTPDHALPPRLYKYLRPEHALALLDHGAIRVGTLYYYRRMELKHGPGIGDQTEGTETVTEVQDGSAVSQFSLGQLKRIFGDRQFRLSGNTFKWNGSIANTLIYCLSTKLSWLTAKESGDYGACIEIINVPRFRSALKTAVAEKMGRECRTFSRAVIYRKTKTYSGAEADAGLPPAPFVKHRHFRFQREFRIALPTYTVRGSDEQTAEAADLDYIDLNVPTLRDFIREVRVPRWWGSFL